MAFVYHDNGQAALELKAFLVKNGISQREVAEKMGIKPQGFTKILNKENFGFRDAQKILSAVGYDLVVDFQKQETPTSSKPEAPK